jgi:hypothetical protein
VIEGNPVATNRFMIAMRVKRAWRGAGIVASITE